MTVQLAQLLAQSLYLGPPAVVLQENPLEVPVETSVTEESENGSKSTMPRQGTA